MFNIDDHLLNPPHISICEALISTLSDDNDDDLLFFSQPRSKKKRYEEMSDASNPEATEGDEKVFIERAPRRDEDDGSIYWYDYYNEIGDMDEVEEIWEPSEDYAFARRMALRKIVSSRSPLTLGKSVKYHEMDDMDEAMDLFCKSEELININKHNAAIQMSKESSVRAQADPVQQPGFPVQQPGSPVQQPGFPVQPPAAPVQSPPEIDKEFDWFEYYYGDFLIKKDEDKCMNSNEVIIID
ncbi:uncharacterized protein LOC124543179 isoform X2 [Vanessa cardui]|uniref:uncharacterized protein LOC124543179 isoform X2 n=1 Tax=Vanessa cardui TaxID=171605 RepID=UPI001F12C85B|nr:uncharacterized protein LOC124543179 isoform X2 [Vanessa cardui]